MTSGTPPAKPDAPPADERRLVEALRAGDERAFAELVERHHAALTRLAVVYAPSRAVADEVVQETWIAVMRGIDRFEGRSSVKTWIFSILANIARTRARSEARSVPFSALGPDGAGDDAGADAPPGLDGDYWAAPPSDWGPEERVLAAETLAHVEAAIARLPARQRAVITLRDIEGWSATEACSVLELTETNQRVLLHRARTKVRAALAGYLERG